MEIISNNPEILTSFDFNRLEQDTTDSVRSVWYRKFLYCIDDLNFYIEIQLEQFISDHPFENNFDNYSYNDMYLIITEDDLSEERYGDNDIKGKKPIRMQTFQQLTQFLTFSEILSVFY